MSPATEQILHAALALTDGERAKLIDALLDGPDDDAPLSPEWLAEIRRRSAEVDAGTVKPIPVSVVIRRLQERVETRRDG